MVNKEVQTNIDLCTAQVFFYFFIQLIVQYCKYIFPPYPKIYQAEGSVQLCYVLFY